MKNFIRIVLLFLPLFTFTNAMTAPFGSINGYVYDKSDGECLIGANVFLQGTNIGSGTNLNGYFSIPKIPAGQYTLVCHYIGYKKYTYDLKITPNSTLKLDIFLDMEAVQAQEIVVTADSVRTSKKLFNKSISQIDIGPRQIKQAPQVVESDLLRSLQTLPGILPISDFSSELYVRGGTPDQNLYLIDGADVYNPEHFFGLFSTFNTDAIKNVEISKGGFGAEYGGRLSSILHVTNLDGNREEFEGNASVSFLSARTTLQMPIGKKGSISGSFRRTYFDQTLAKFIDEIPDYYFYDGHVKAFFEIDPNNKLTISTYIGRDDLDFKFDSDSDNSETMDYDWGNSTASVRWTHIFSPRLFSNFWVTGSAFRSDFGFELASEKNEINDITFKSDLEFYATNELSTKFGIEYKHLDGFLKQEFPGGLVDVSSQAKHIAGYMQTNWRPNPLWDINAGLRLNIFSAAKTYYNLAPRISAKYRLSDTMNLKAAFGTYNQYLFKIPRTFIVDIWTTSDEYYKGAKANHYILGFQKEIAENIEFEVETYYKDYKNIYSYDYFFYADLEPTKFTDAGEPVYGTTKGIFDTGMGHSYGLEFLLRKDIGCVTGWMSYSLGKTKYKLQDVNNNRYFPPRHDRASTINLVGNVDIKNSIRKLKGKAVKNDKSKWRLGIGFVYASGQPLTTTSSLYVTAPLPDQLYDDGLNLYPTTRNNFRLPAYMRLDLSLTYEKKYTNWTLAPYLQVFNAGNRKNVWYITYDREIKDDMLYQEIETVNMFPILPTLGVNINF